MENFILELTGTQNLWIVLAGFIWALIGLISYYVFNGKKLTLVGLIANLLTILITMRFTSLIIGSDIFNASIGIIAGFSAEILREKIILLFTKDGH